MPRAFTKDDITAAERFTIELVKSAKSRVVSVALNRVPVPAEKMAEQPNQIPLVVLIDDLASPLLESDVHSYLSSVKRHLHSVSKRLYVSTLKLSEHWELCRISAPHHLDFLRYGLAIYDKGFFDPMRQLVTKGRIRPTFEAEGVYIARADGTLKNASHHLLQASLDLYWASVDACHAALMSQGQMPPEPADVAKEMTRVLVGKRLLEPQYPLIMQALYELSRGIMHKSIVEISGEDYDHYHSQSSKLIKRMEKIVG